MKQTIALLFCILIVSACGKGPANSSNTGSIDLVGFQRVDQTVTAYVNLADRNGTTEANLSYQWYANNSALVGETNSTIELVSDWLNLPMHVVVSYTDDDGFTETIKSETIDVLEAFLVLTMIADSEQSWKHAQTLDNNSLWATPVDIVVSDPGTEYVYEVEIATDFNGHLVAMAYSEDSDVYSDAPVVFSYSHDNGETWSESARIAASGNDYDPQVAYAGNGTWVAVWVTSVEYDSNGTDSDLVYSTSVDNGVTWTSPKHLGDHNSSSDSQPALAVQGNHWFVAWRSRDSLSGTIGDDSDVLYTTSSNGGATWATTQALNSDAATDNGASDGSGGDLDYYPTVSMTESGFGIVAWSGRSGGHESDIFGATTTDFGVTWSNAQMINSYGSVDSDSAPFDFDYPYSVIANDNGSSVVTWQGVYAEVYGDDTEPFYAVSTDNGVTWSDARSMKSGIDTDTIYDSNAQILQNPNGGWIGTWTDSDVWIATSTDLVTWSTPTKNGMTSDYPVGWIFH